MNDLLDFRLVGLIQSKD